MTISIIEYYQLYSESYFRTFTKIPLCYLVKIINNDYDFHLSSIKHRLPKNTLKSKNIVTDHQKLSLQNITKNILLKRKSFKRRIFIILEL